MNKKAMGFVGIIVIIILIVVALYWFIPDKAPAITNSTLEGVKTGVNSIGNVVKNYATNKT